jgi:hypothetical protein
VQGAGEVQEKHICSNTFLSLHTCHAPTAAPERQPAWELMGTVTAAERQVGKTVRGLFDGSVGPSLYLDQTTVLLAVCAVQYRIMPRCRCKHIHRTIST